MTTTAITTTAGAQLAQGTQAAAAYLASLRTPVSRASMESELRKIAGTLGYTTTTKRGAIVGDWRAVPWHTLNAANVGAILAQLAQGAPASMNKTRAALRGVARSLWRLGVIDSEQLARIEDIKPARGTRELSGRNVEEWEIAALMRACASDPTPAGARDASVIALGYHTGARREELAKIAIADMTQTPEGYEVRVIGKGNKERTLYVFNGAAKALGDWLAIRGTDAGALFCAINKSGKIAPGHTMTTTALHKVLTRRAAEAGVTGLTWHDFRRTFAGALLDRGEDIATVSQLMGHASVTTTARYDRRPAETRRKAARRLSVPYFARHG